jgi:hypothetical protein
MIGLVADVAKITRQPRRKNFHSIRWARVVHAAGRGVGVVTPACVG